MENENAWRSDWHRAYAYTNGSILKRTLTCARAPGVQAITVYRFGVWVKQRNLISKIIMEPIFFVLNGLIKIIWGIELPRGTKIGAGIYIGHFGGVIISRHATIGRNCNLSQGVTIGFSKGGAPTIGDNVYIAPGAKVFGPINIGSNVKIGANAVVYADIPDNATVALVPGFTVISCKENTKLPEI